MSLTFDATLKDLAREHVAGFLELFDKPPDSSFSLLNVDLSTVTTAPDLVVGLGQPLTDIVHLDFQSSASATKQAELLVYNALLFRHYLVPVHSILVLLRPQAAHFNLNGLVRYASRPQRGSMNFSYEVVRLWERPAEEFLTGNLGALPLAPLGQLPQNVSVERSIGHYRAAF